MKKSFFILFVFFILLISRPSCANEFSVTSYYPIPMGKHSRINLTPQPALTSSNCNLGTFYANANDNNRLYFCGLSIIAIPEFAPFEGPWKLDSNSLHLSDTSSPANKKVGIGTETPAFKLTLTNDGGILADNISGSSTALPLSGTGTKMLWYPAKAAFRAGYVSGDEWDDANIGANSMAMGYGNKALATATTVWGGQNNTAAGTSSVIAGGKNNSTTNLNAQILGGEDNSGGTRNRIAGKNNIGCDNGCTIGGGEGHRLDGVVVKQGVTIGGGLNNSANATEATISGGRENVISSGTNSTISGGYQNTINAPSDSTISGGKGNSITNTYGVISGGESNSISGMYGTISGGKGGTVSGLNGVIMGGLNNNCLIDHCTIAGGVNNSTSGKSATVAGGLNNSATSYATTVVGGSNNAVKKSYSLAAGRYTNLSAVGSFLWGYANSLIPVVTTDYNMIIYSGLMGIRDLNPAALLEINGNSSSDDYLNLTSTSAASTGDVLTIKNNGRIGVYQTNPQYPLEFGNNGAYVSATGNFMPSSSRKYKENIADLDLTQATEAFWKLEPVRYNYKNEVEEEYVGFILEDVPELIANPSSKGLAPLDITAVLTKVVSHQQEIIEQQKLETEELLKEVGTLKLKIKQRIGQSQL